MSFIWIDTQTGTWGRLDNLVVLGDSEVDAFLDSQEDMTDSEICQFGEDFGDALTLPNGM